MPRPSQSILFHIILHSRLSLVLSETCRACSNTSDPLNGDPEVIRQTLRELLQIFATFLPNQNGISQQVLHHAIFTCDSYIRLFVVLCEGSWINNVSVPSWNILALQRHHLMYPLP